MSKPRFTTAQKKMFKLLQDGLSNGKSIFIIYGGQTAGKTYGICEIILSELQHRNFEHQSMIIGSSWENLKTRAYQDVANILELQKTKNTAKTLLIKNNQLIFTGIREGISMRTQFIFINEFSEIELSEVDEFIKRARITIIDFNPSFNMEAKIDDLKKQYGDMVAELKLTYLDNEYCPEGEIKHLQQLKKLGKEAPVGTRARYNYEVYVLGNYAELVGTLIAQEDLQFIDKLPDSLHSFVAFADPSNAQGGDDFAISLTAIYDNNVYLIDSYNSNFQNKGYFYKKLKEWKDIYNAQIIIETNGEFGQQFYKDCINSNLEVKGWWSSNKKFDRIFANLDVFFNNLRILDTENNKSFVFQWYSFEQNMDKKTKDDNIDCVNNAIMYYQNQGFIKKLFE